MVPDFDDYQRLDRDTRLYFIVNLVAVTLHNTQRRASGEELRLIHRHCASFFPCTTHADENVQ